MNHDINKGYYFNYLIDASHCYWAARMLEINYRSLDEKDKMIDALLVKRLRNLADDLVKQAVEGLETKRESVSEGLELMKQLAGEHSK